MRAAFASRFFLEEWKGFAAQKNSALEKCSCDWILSLDADESLSDELAKEIWELLERDPPFDGYALPRRNLFLGRWMRFGGFYPDPKLRLFRRGAAEFEARPVHETLHFVGKAGRLKGDMVHDAYPTLEAYIAHMDRYSTLGAEQAVREGKSSLPLGRSRSNVVLNPVATFVYNYFFRLGFLDGREGSVAPPLPLGVCELEVCQGLGAGAQLRIFLCQRRLGAPYLARSLRDVGYHRGKPQAFGPPIGSVRSSVVESHISQKTSEIWGTRGPLRGKNSAQCLLRPGRSPMLISLRCGYDESTAFGGGASLGGDHAGRQRSKRECLRRGALYQHLWRSRAPALYPG